MTPSPFKQPSFFSPGSQPQIQHQVAGQISNSLAIVAQNFPPGVSLPYPALVATQDVASVDENIMRSSPPLLQNCPILVAANERLSANRRIFNRGLQKGQSQIPQGSLLHICHDRLSLVLPQHHPSR